VESTHDEAPLVPDEVSLAIEVKIDIETGSTEEYVYVSIPSTRAEA
jgi:hypothetical protein